MADPQRKPDNNPDIRPNLRVIDGGAETDPSRANLRIVETSKDLQNRENGNVIKGPWDNSPVKEAEEAGDDSLEGGLYKPSETGQKKRVDFKSIIRGKGAIGALVGLVFGAGLGFSALLSPSLLIVHMKEIMVAKLNTQLTSMDARTSKILNTKISNTTKGLCTSVVTIKCKFSTMSETQVKNFKDAGIGVEPDTPNAGTRTKPTGYVWKDKKISAGEFAKLASSDPEFKLALRKGYNPKYAGLAGKAWSKASEFLGISKKPPDLEGATDEERMKKLNEVAKKGNTSAGVRTAAEFEDEKAGCNTECAQAKADAANSVVGDLQKDGESGAAAKKATALLEGAPIEAVEGVAKITGVVDYACQAYSALNAVGLAAKTIRAVQLARYAMVFMNAADQIKATGGLSSKTASFLGNTLTNVTKDANGNVVSGAATDSYGYKYAAYGDVSASATSMKQANRFLTGGGFAGDLANFSSTVLSFIPGGRQGARTTCGVLANPVVGGISLVAGVASFFVPGANVFKIAAQGAVGITIGVGLSLLPALLSDTIAGTTTANINGEASGNAWFSGAGKTLSDTVSGLNGNGLMNKTDAAAYMGAQASVAASYGKDESLALSPFDPTNQYTFLGSIVSKLLPITGSISSGGSLLASFGSVLSTSFASIIPTSSALTTKQYSAALNVCQDQDSADAGYATDPFCNVIRGIPLQYLNKDPLVVVDELIASGDLAPDTQLPTTQYQSFISKCIDNTNPPGYDTAETTGFDAQGAKDCIINDSNANRFLNYLDTRVQAGQDGEDTVNSKTNAAPLATADATIDQAHVFDDSTSIACAAGTTDAGITQGYHNGTEINIRLCSIPGTADENHGNQLIRVNSRMSGATLGITKALAASPANKGRTDLKVSDSFRSMQEQQSAFLEYGFPRAARPGFSNHQMGLALDFQLGLNKGSTRPGDPVYDWLVANAATYGFSKISSESWHWQAIGVN
jgi:hypothetical protein